MKVSWKTDEKWYQQESYSFLFIKKGRVIRHRCTDAQTERQTLPGNTVGHYHSTGAGLTLKPLKDIESSEWENMMRTCIKHHKHAFPAYLVVVVVASGQDQVGRPVLSRCSMSRSLLDDWSITSWLPRPEFTELTELTHGSHGQAPRYVTRLSKANMPRGTLSGGIQIIQIHVEKWLKWEKWDWPMAQPAPVWVPAVEFCCELATVAGTSPMASSPGTEARFDDSEVFLAVL